MVRYGTVVQPSGECILYMHFQSEKLRKTGGWENLKEILLNFYFQSFAAIEILD
jgi:hypothetical protein